MTVPAALTPRAGRRGPLTSAEVTDAAVLGGVTLVLSLVGLFVPYANAATALAAVPMAVLSYRRRHRALIAGAVAAATVGFLVAGSGPLSAVAGCALVGGVAGFAHRRRWGLAPTLVLAVAISPPLALAADAFLALFAHARQLTLAQVHNTWKGAAAVLNTIPGAQQVVGPLTTAVDTALRWWWISVPILVLLSVVAGVAVAWAMTRPVLQRLAWVRVDEPWAAAPGGEPDPVPVVLRGVTFRYPGAEAWALRGIDLEVEAGRFTAVVGPNGSGKSTLARILVGAEPAEGEVIRPGDCGLGRVGGSALILQRPETQVLGVRVVDDIMWGLSPDDTVDVDGLLETVGLAGMGQRDTSTLSGGELQRLAVASALARRPRLLVSDESTAMVDAEGRRLLVGLLRRIARERDTAVVHVTHRMEEAAGADCVVMLRDGRVVDGTYRRTFAAPPGRRPVVSGPCLLRPGGGAAAQSTDLVLSGVGHVWADRTPWRNRALDRVDLRVGAGEGVLILGSNGSGKSTLAWIMAGLLVPSEGDCLLDGQYVDQQVGAVGLAFQHARLQLQRPTVVADVRHAGGVGWAAAVNALEAVGLDPHLLGNRPIDELSGGQMRRVALAGILARSPRVVVLDEPLAGLDEEAQAALLAALRELREHRGVSVIMVSHDVAGTEECCDRVVKLEGGRVAADQPLAAALG